MAFAVPTVADFKSRFDRDFAFAKDQTDLTKVRDVDVQRGLTQAGVSVNPALFDTQARYSEAALVLAAHFLCQNLLASSQGLQSAAQWLTSSKAVGNISEAFSIPDRIAKSPILSAYSKTQYGMQYLAMVTPYLVGNVQHAEGATLP